jgi:hypothetical protein
MSESGGSSCCKAGETNQLKKIEPRAAGLQPLPMFKAADDTVCCGPPPPPPSSPWERPGYRLQHFVEDFMDTPGGPVPIIKTKLERKERIGTLLARASSLRSDYLVAPGLYAVGRPDRSSPVLVTANYKLTFDAVRRELRDNPSWLLVLDTRGINVWCAAGKELFSTAEVIRLVNLTSLGRVVDHRRLILPQLGATGVSAQGVKRGCGFEVVWGPVRIRDIRAFLSAGLKADRGMRLVSFTLPERAILVPIELAMLKKPVFWALLIILVLSGIGPSIYSLGAAWHRGMMAATALLLGILTGAVLSPILLPWLPTPSFSVKGAVAGLLGGAVAVGIWWGRTGLWGGLAMMLLATGLSSYLAMNFTGSTPYTSPSGVEKEMRRAMPMQAAALVGAVFIWVGAAFVG